MPGRTVNDVKNYWHAYVKKRNRRNAEATANIKQQPCEAPPLTGIKKEKQSNQISRCLTIQNEASSKDIVVAESSCLQDSENSVPLPNNANCVASDSTCSDLVEGNFWTEPCQINYFELSPELSYGELLSSNSYILSPPHWFAGGGISSSDVVAEPQIYSWSEPYLSQLEERRLSRPTLHTLMIIISIFFGIRYI